jgi:hypothetical protein
VPPTAASLASLARPQPIASFAMPGSHVGIGARTARDFGLLSWPATVLDTASISCELRSPQSGCHLLWLVKGPVYPERGVLQQYTLSKQVSLASRKSCRDLLERRLPRISLASRPSR